jgi:hypothetical protein
MDEMIWAYRTKQGRLVKPILVSKATGLWIDFTE